MIRVTVTRALTAALLLAMTTQPAAQAQYPVRWTRAAGPPSRQALHATFRAPVKPRPEPRIYDHKREIRTCVDWARARKDWEGNNATEYDTAGDFDNRCGTLALVLRAKPSRISYVKGFKLDEAALDLLPASLTSGFDDDREEADQAVRQGLSWKKFKPGLKILKRGGNAIAVLEPDSPPAESQTPDENPSDNNDVRVYLEIKAFGDFNGDGIEDILLFTSDAFLYHSLRASGLRLLTRLTPGGPLKEIEIESAEIEKAMTRASRSRTASQVKKAPPAQ